MQEKTVVGTHRVLGKIKTDVGILLENGRMSKGTGIPLVGGKTSKEGGTREAISKTDLMIFGQPCDRVYR